MRVITVLEPGRLHVLDPDKRSCYFQNPNDISYVYSGYAPLSVRLAQQYHRPGWRSITEVLPLLPGALVEEIQQIPVGLRKRRMFCPSPSLSLAVFSLSLCLFCPGNPAALPVAQVEERQQVPCYSVSLSAHLSEPAKLLVCVLETGTTWTSKPNLS